MGRWEPNAEGRLRAAAMELFIERGYDKTTVADIAERSGLTSRTFFRHFSDKREVLFNGSERLQESMTEGLANAPFKATPIDAVAAALAASAGFFGDNREFARQRSAIIAANPELYERELIKLATLSAALAKSLRARGVAEPDASLAAEAGMAVFRVAFARWVERAEVRGFGEIVSEAMARLRAISALN